MEATTAAPSASVTADMAGIQKRKQHPPKVDPITALQEEIDGLSLAMFEALRGLRDAVAPESGNLGYNHSNVVAEDPTLQQQQQQQAPPIRAEELWALYQEQARGGGEEDTTAHDAGGGARPQQPLWMPAPPPPAAAVTSPAALMEWYTTTATERQKDAALVATLARAVLRQSAAIDRAVDQLVTTTTTADGTTIAARTRTRQLQYLQELIQQNAQAALQLEDVYAQALERRNQCRQFVLDCTSRALGMEEMK